MGIVTAAVNPNESAYSQIGGNDPNGTQFGSLNVPLAFFGGTPVAQPAGNSQAAQVRGAAAGIVSTYSTFQTNVQSAGVGVITSAEYGMTVMQGTTTNSRLLVTSGDMIYINKPTAQAGLGVGNVRVSASNVIGVTLTNYTAATITPTTNQTYSIVAIRGLPTISATLSPAAVAPNTTIEQQFTIVPTAAAPQGIAAGSLVQVSKPTSQAGLDIVGCRAVSNNVVGITFANVTAATITPTASESYTIQSLQALDALNNYLTFSLNFGAIGAIGAGLVISAGNVTCGGVLASDIPIGPPAQVTAQAAATNATAPIFSILGANTLTPYFLSAGTGATPTANLTYDQLVFRLNPAAPLVIYTPALAPVSVAANTTAEQTFTVTGLIASTPVWVNKPSWTAGLGIAGVRVSAANTLAINYANTSAAAIVPPSETYIIGNFQQVAVGATTSNTSGGAVSQPAVTALNQGLNQLYAVRNGLVGLGLIAGA
jgi:hypothetical protein